MEELKSAEGKHYQKFQRIKESAYRLRLRGVDVLIWPPNTLNITEYAFEGGMPDASLLGVRKRLKNARVKSVYQHGTDRVAVFEFDNDYKLVIELFAKGNVVLVDDAGLTFWAHRYEAWKDRVIKPKKPYSFPAGRAIDFKEGKVRTSKELDEELAQKVVEEEDTKRGKVEHRLKEQLAAVEKFKQQEVEFRAAGDYIFQHKNELEELVKKAKALRKKSMSWKEVSEELGVKVEDGRIVLEVQ